MNSLHLNRFREILSVATIAGALLLSLGQNRSLAVTAETWTGTTSGTWESAANWTPTSTYPSNNTYSATFGTSTSTNVELTQNETAQALTFSNSASSYTFGSFGGAYTLTIDSFTTTAVTSITGGTGSGTQTFDVNVAVGSTAQQSNKWVAANTSGQTITFAPGYTLTLGLAGNTAQSVELEAASGGGTINVDGNLIDGQQNGNALALNTSAGTVNLNVTNGATTLFPTLWVAGTGNNIGTSFGTAATTYTLNAGTGGSYQTGSTSLILTGQNITLTGTIETLGNSGKTDADVLESNYAGTAVNTVNGAVTLSGSSGNLQSFELEAAANNTLKVTGAISLGVATDSALSIVGPGTIYLTGANTYTMTNTAISGNATVVVTNAEGLSTGAVTMSAGSTLDYMASASAAFNKNSTLTIASGSGTTIGGSIGNTITTNEIDPTTVTVTGTGAIGVNIYGINGVTTTNGTYTLLAAGSGNLTSSGASYNLGTVYNNTNFTISNLTATNTALTVTVATATALTNAYWVGSGIAGTTNVWAASNGTGTSNWSGTSLSGAVQALIPGSGATVTIGNGASSTVLGANMSIAGLVIAGTNNGLGLNADGNTLTISGTNGITDSASVPASFIAAGVALGTNQTWTNSSANALTVSGTVSGANNLTVAGTGTIILSGVNTFTGSNTVTGYLQLGSNTALPNSALNTTASTGVVTIAPGVTSPILGGLTGSTALATIFSSGYDNATALYLNPASGTTNSYSGALGGATPTLIKIGAGTQVLTNANTAFTAGVGIDGGNLQVGTNSALGTGTISFDGGILKYGSGITQDLSSQFSTAGGQAFSIDLNGQSVTFASVLAGNNSSLTTTNTGGGTPTLTLTAANTFSGTTTVGSSNSIVLGNNLALQDSDLATSTNAVSLASSVTTPVFGGLSGTNAFLSTITSSNDVTSLTLNPQNGFSDTYSGVIANSSNNMTLTKTGLGTQILTGVNTYTGGTTVNGGTLQIGTTTTTTDDIPDSPSLTLGGGTLSLTTTNTASVVLTFSSGTTLNQGGVSGVTAGTNDTISLGAITRNVGGTVNFTTATGSAIDTSTTNNVNGIMGGWATYGGTTWAVAPASAGGAITGLANYLETGTTNTGTSNYSSSSNVDINGSLTIAGAISVNSLRFSTNSAETLTLASGTNTITTGGILVSSAVSGKADIITGGTITTSNTDMVIFQNDTSAGGTLTIGSIIAGTDGLTQAGAGTTILTASNTYTGATTVGAGTLQVGNGTTGAIANGTASTVALGATLVFDGTNATTYGGNITNSGTVAGFEGSGSTNTLSGNISGGGAFAQTGPGTTILSGTNTYTGATTLSAGALNIQSIGALGSAGGQSSGVTVLSGAALQLQGGYSTTEAVGLTLNGAGLTGSPNGALENVSGTNTYTGLITLGSTTTIGSDTNTLILSNTGTITSPNGPNALTLTGAGNGSLASIIGTGAGTLTKSGTGTWTLTGSNTYSGGTTINAGTLEADGGTQALGTSASAVMVGGTNSTGTPTLSGTGVIAGAVTVSSSNGGVAGTIQPGSIANQYGTLTVGSIAFQTNSTFGVNLSSTSNAELVSTGLVTTTGTDHITFSGSTGATTTTGTGNYVLATATGGLTTGAFTGTAPTDYRLLGNGTALDLTHEATIGAITPTPAVGSIITGGTDAFTITVSNTAPANSSSLSAGATAGSNVTGSITTNTITTAPQTTGSSYSGLSFNGATVGAGQTGSFTVSDPNADNTPQTGTVTENVYGHASGSLSGSTLNLGDVHVGYTAPVTSGNSVTASNAAGYRVNLAGSAVPSGYVSVNSISGVAAGSSTNILATLATGQSVGAISTPLTYTFADSSSLSGATNNVGTAAITVSGEVYSGQSTWNTNGSGSWGTLASGFGTNWGLNQGSPGLDSNFTSTDTATFGTALAANGTANVTLDGANPSLNTITFNDTNANASYTLAQGSGGTITLNGGAGNATVANANGANTISAQVNLATNANVNVSSGQQLTFSGNISGGYGLNNIGAGTTILTASNSYIGATSITAGTLNLQGGSVASGSAVTVSNGGTLGVGALGGTGTAAGTVTVAGGGTINVNGGGTGVLNTGALTLNGTSGSQSLLDFGLTTSGVTTSLDEISVTGNLTFSSSDGTVITITNLSGTPNLGDYNLITTTSGVVNSGNVVLSTNSMDGDTLTLAVSGDNLQLDITSGSVTPALAYWNGSQDNNWTTVNSGNANWSTAVSGGTNTGAAPGSVSDVVFATSTAVGTNTVLGTNTAINSLTFVSSNAYGIGNSSNSLTILAASSSNNTAGTGITVQSGAGADSISANVVLGTNQTWTNSSTNTLTVSGQVSDTNGTTTLTTAGSGTVDLSNTTNTYGGGTTINSGVLQIAAAQSLGTGTNVSIVGGSSLSAPTVLQYNGTGNATLSQNITITTNFGLIDNGSGGVLTLSGPISKNGSVLVLAGGQFVVSGVISGASNRSDLVLGSSTYGSSVVGLTTNNTYNGPTSITYGSTLLTGVNNALPTTAPSDVTFGAVGESATINTLDLLGNSETVASLNVGSTNSNVVNQVISSSGSASPTPAIGLTSSSNTGTLNVDYTTTNTPDTFNGSLGGSGSANNFNLVKSGAGTLVLSGSNTYSGSTTVSGGNLQVTGTYTGNGGTTVGNGSPNSGTLSGHGTAGSVGGITVASGGTISPGDSTTTVGPNLTSSNTVNNVLTGTGLTLNGGATLSYNLYSAVASTGTSSNPAGGTVINLDLGSLTFTAVTSAAPLTINLNSTGIGGYGQVNGTQTALLFGTANVYDLIEFGSSSLTNTELALDLQDGAIVIKNLTAANINPSNSAMLVIVAGTGGEQYLQLDIVPEPSTWAMFALGLGFLFFVVRRRMVLTIRKP